MNKRLDGYNGVFKNLDMPEKTYWFGFIVGDGCININIRKGRYQFGVHLKDREQVEKLALFLGYTKDRVVKSREKYYQLTVGCKQLVNDLMNLGLEPRKSLTITNNIIPNNYKWDFIRGLFDADGCIHLRNRLNVKALNPYISIVGTYSLLKGIQEIISQGGQLENNRSKNGRVDRLSYEGRRLVTSILNKIYYAQPALNRKLKLYTQIKDYDKEYELNIKDKRNKSILEGNEIYYTINCLYCGNTFIVSSYRVNQGGQHGLFCCKSHASAYRWRIKREENYAYNAM